MCYLATMSDKCSGLKRENRYCLEYKCGFIRSKHCTNNGAEAILMRDTDIGFKSVFVAKRDTMKGYEEIAQAMGEQKLMESKEF